MDELIANFHAAQDNFSELVNAVTDDQWDAPTPDTDWTVADLVAHLVSEHRWAPPLLRGMDLDSAAVAAESADASGDLARDWRAAAAASAAAVDEPDVLSRTVALSRGPAPASTYLGEMVFDLVVHAWDLGTTIGHSQPVPDVLAGYVYQRVGGHDLSASGLFAEPVQVPADAPVIDRLVAATGRDPRAR